MLNLLRSLNIVRGNDTQVERVFSALVPDFRLMADTPPAEYVRYCIERFDAYKRNANELSAGQERGLNGKYFETVLATLFYNRKLVPFYLSAKVAFVPDILYDFIFYDKTTGPVCVSAKTSLRERYKQADLEAMALKSVHRRSESYLLTLDGPAATQVAAKIRAGDMLGLDGVVDAESADMDRFVEAMSGREFAVPGQVSVVTSSQAVGLSDLRLHAAKMLFA